MSDINKITHSIEWITPEQAKSWLKNDNVENNRNISSTRVARYALDIAEGKWCISQPLIFSDGLELIDGQHGLAAVVKANKPTQFLIIRGVDKNALDVIDTGKPRSTDNIAHLKGVGLSKDHIACFNGMFLAPGCDNKKLRTLSPIQVIEKAQTVHECLRFACSGNSGNMAYQDGRLRHSAVNAVVARAYHYENHERLTLFLEGFRTGFITGENDYAAVALRNLYLNFKKSTAAVIKGERGFREDVFLYTQVALGHFLKQNPVRRLHIPKEPKNLWHVEVVDGPKKK
jgi:hypothetical protein